jgi:GTPase involved in cell partitioning and DNA repair
VFLPFLYPSFFAPSGISRSGLAATLNGTRRSSTEAGASRLNPAPDDYSMPYFADKARLTIHAGGGGNGCISFLREAFMEDGPANGGDGGHGGNVYIQAVHGETSLHKLARRKVIRAGKGKSGMGSSRSGQRGEDVVIAVPVGTVVREISRDDPEGESRFMRKRHRKRKALPVEEGPDGEPVEDPERHKWLIYPGISSSDMKRIELPRLPNRDPIFLPPKPPVLLDLSRPTPRPILLAVGGIGGLGNPHFVSKGTPKPMFATKGEPAMSMEIELELKLLADVGLVGLPNAGKSTLLRSISNSRTRVGDWAFTTLQPNIGTVVLDNNKGRPMLTSYRKVSDTPPSRDDPFNTSSSSEPEVERRTRFTIADIPGLIEGAHLDKGLGIAFLRHVERAGVLAFVLDLGAGNAVKALKALWNEVGLYAQMREDEERERQRQAAVDWSATAGTDVEDDTFWLSSMAMGPDGAPTVNAGGLHIAGKPWFVVATKGDLPDTRRNFDELRDYLAAVSRGDEPHPSGVEGAWIHDCRAIPVSAIKGEGVERVVHWAVGLLDG